MKKKYKFTFEVVDSFGKPGKVYRNYTLAEDEIQSVKEYEAMRLERLYSYDVKRIMVEEVGGADGIK